MTTGIAWIRRRMRYFVIGRPSFSSGWEAEA
jgi:hypothetical protein